MTFQQVCEGGAIFFAGVFVGMVFQIWSEYRLQKRERGRK